MKYKQPIIEILRMGYEDVICLSSDWSGDNDNGPQNTNIENINISVR